MSRKILTAVILSCLTVAFSSADEAGVRAHDAPTEVILSLRNEAQAAIDRAEAWLLKNQSEEGHWSNPYFPALTALPLWALAMGGDVEGDHIDAAVDYLLSCVHPDGAIFREPTEERRGGGLSNYNTAICMVGLHALGRPELVPVIQDAREYLAESQHLGDDIYAGGMGYDRSTDRAYADLSNSYIAYEAMRLTESVEDLRGEGEERVDLDWDAALKFIQRTHNHPDFNEQPWVNPDPNEVGGFAYHPDQTRAGVVEDESGLLRFRSMPGMTYAGLLSYIYAEVDRDDPRVQATINWAINHWSLEEASRDPEKVGTAAAREGLYYLINVISKGLAAYGQDVFRPEDGKPFNWRIDLIEKLVGDQRIEPDGTGYWVNDVSRYWEGDKVLTTAYSLIALQLALQK